MSIGSLTKAYGLGALRIGWCILGEGVVELRQDLVDRANLIGLDLPTPCLRAARAALDHLPELLQPLLRIQSTSRPILERWLASSERVEGIIGALTPFAFPRILGVDDTRALARHLAREVAVDAVPGEFFGAPGHLRLGYAVPEATLIDALDRLDRGIASFPS